MSIKDKLISNTTFLFFNWFSVSLLSMIYWLIIGKTLSPFSYGVIATSFQVMTILSGISLLGTTTAMSKLIPELLQKKELRKIQGLINFSFKIILTVSLIISFSLIIFSGFIPSFLKLQQEVLWIISLSNILFALGLFTSGVYLGFQDMKGLFFTNFIGNTIKVFIAFILIIAGFDYFGPLIGFLFALFIVTILRLKKKYLKVSEKIETDKKLILEYSMPAFVTSVLLLIFNYTQYIILTVLKTIQTTGLFAVAMTITSIIPVIPTVLRSSLLPIISSLSIDKNSKSKQNYLIRLVFRYALFLTLPIVVFIIAFGRYFILFFAKPDYLPATTLLPFLTLAAMFLGLGDFFLSSLYAIGKPKKRRDTQAIAVMLYLILSIPLTYYFSGVGLAIAYLISTILSFSIGFYFIKKYLKIKLLAGDIGRIILATFISFIFLLLMRQFTNNFLTAGIFVVIGGVIYLLVLLNLNFYLEEDLKVIDFLADRSPLFKRRIMNFRNYLGKFVKRSYVF